VAFNYTEFRNELAECFNAAIDRNEEGIVAKRPNSTYCIGKKTVSGGWIKLKQDYIDCLCDDVDLVAVGASYGAHGVFNSFLMALVDDSIGDNGAFC
jgi:DNA ligase-4